MSRRVFLSREARDAQRGRVSSDDDSTDSYADPRRQPAAPARFGRSPRPASPQRLELPSQHENGTSLTRTPTLSARPRSRSRQRSPMLTEGPKSPNVETGGNAELPSHVSSTKQHSSRLPRPVRQPISHSPDPEQHRSPIVPREQNFGRVETRARSNSEAPRPSRDKFLPDTRSRPSLGSHVTRETLDAIEPSRRSPRVRSSEHESYSYASPRLQNSTPSTTGPAHPLASRSPRLTPNKLRSPNPSHTDEIPVPAYDPYPRTPEPQTEPPRVFEASNEKQSGRTRGRSPAGGGTTSEYGSKVSLGRAAGVPPPQPISVRSTSLARRETPTPSEAASGLRAPLTDYRSRSRSAAGHRVDVDDESGHPKPAADSIRQPGVEVSPVPASTKYERALRRVRSATTMETTTPEHDKQATKDSSKATWSKSSVTPDSRIAKSPKEDRPSLRTKKDLENTTSGASSRNEASHFHAVSSRAHPDTIYPPPEHLEPPKVSTDRDKGWTFKDQDRVGPPKLEGVLRPRTNLTEGNSRPNASKRLSKFRRITTSPLPPPEPSENNAENQDYEDYHRPAPAPQPLFLALNDALSRPYVHPRNTSTDPAPRPSTHDSSSKPQDDRGRSGLLPYESARPGVDSDDFTPGFGISSHDLTSVASDLSLMLTASSRISEGDTSISGPAEELFKTLGIRPSHSYTGGADSDAYGPGQQGWDQSSSERYHSFRSGESHGAAEAGDGHIPETWRETLPDDVYNTLLAHYDVFEMRRQELIWDLCRSEGEFVGLLHTMVELFVKPLRTENDTRWIPGLDPSIAKLFDWLDDISHIHSEVLAVMEGCRANQLPIVTQIGESLRPFVSRLEIYQPYLVRVDDICETIREMTQDPESDFGEFIRIQTQSENCPGALPDLLQRPIERLMRYPSIFKQIYSLTPRRHEDHLSIFALLHGSEMMIRVLQSVKKQEVEYEEIKVLSLHLRGLPSNFHLASRGRHLIGQGPLLRVYPDLDAAADWSMPEIDYTPPPAPSFDGRFPSNGTQDLLWPNLSRRNQEDRYPRPAPPPGTSSAPPNSHFFGRGHARQPSLPASEWIYAFVFTDVVVLTKHIKYVDERGMANEYWEVLDNVGIARVLGFQDLSDATHEHLIALDLLPLDTNRSLPHPSATLIHLSLAERTTGRMSLAPARVLEEARKQWSDAFSRCFVYTMRSLSFPASYDGRMNSGKGALDSIMSVLSSDRPLPKSPSAQLLDHDLEPADQERQERDWWSARFQEVLEELSTGGQVEDNDPVIDTTRAMANWDLLAEEESKKRVDKPSNAHRRASVVFKESTAKLLKLKG